jgi:hypothetical protein
MPALTILCWLWSQQDGRTRYTAHHVNCWAAMVRRHLTLPHRLACVTDTPDGIDPAVEIIPPPGGFEDVRIPTWSHERPQCFRRLAMFRRDAARIFGERFVCMDVDCVIGASLDPLFARGEDIVLYASPPSPIPQPRPYNGSMLLMTAGARPQVHERFTPEGAAAAGALYVGSDQAWFSHVLGPGEATWGEADGVVWWGRSHSAPPPLRAMFFPGHPKPWDLLGSDRWVREHFRGDRGGRCLVLGYRCDVWDDLAAAVRRGPFDAVIASPEAAEHWPGRLLAVVETDGEAAAVATMNGFAEVVWCGRSSAA